MAGVRVEEQERERVYEDLKRKAEEILEEMDVDKAIELAREHGVDVLERPVVVERDVRVFVGRTMGYAQAIIRLYLPWYIVRIAINVNGFNLNLERVGVNIEPAVNIDNSCSCEG